MFLLIFSCILVVKMLLHVSNSLSLMELTYVQVIHIKSCEWNLKSSIMFEETVDIPYIAPPPTLPGVELCGICILEQKLSTILYKKIESY